MAVLVDQKTQEWRTAHSDREGFYVGRRANRATFRAHMRRAVVSTINAFGHERGRRLRILEVGCGSGLDSICLALLGHDVTTVDVSDYLLVEARRFAAAAATLFPERAMNLRFARADVFDLREYAGQYDLVLSFGLTVIWRHAGVRLRAMRNMRAALRPDGALLLGTTHTLNPLFRLIPVIPLVADLADHNLPILEDEVRRSGFRVRARGAAGLSAHFDQWLAHTGARTPLKIANWCFERLPSRWQLPVAPHLFVLATVADPPPGEARMLDAPAGATVSDPVER